MKWAKAALAATWQGANSAVRALASLMARLQGEQELGTKGGWVPSATQTPSEKLSTSAGPFICLSIAATFFLPWTRECAAVGAKVVQEIRLLRSRWRPEGSMSTETNTAT